MLYERNSIHMITDDGVTEKGVYATFPCEDDGEYDFLFLKNISMVSMYAEPVDFINNANYCVKKNRVTFRIQFNEELDPNNVAFIASIEEFDSTPVYLELQSFVDELVATIYENVTFDSSEVIKSLKKEAIEKLVIEYFQSTGEIAVNELYNTVGRFVDNNGETVMLCNNFYVNADDGKATLTLNNCVSYMPLKDLSVSKIEFTTGSAKLVINDYEIIESKEGTLKTYVIKVKDMYTEKTDEEPIAETSSVVDDDLYFDTMTALLGEREKVFSSTSANDSFENMFDDFDF